MSGTGSRTVVTLSHSGRNISRALNAIGFYSVTKPNKNWNEAMKTQKKFAMQWSRNHRWQHDEWAHQTCCGLFPACRTVPCYISVDTGLEMRWSSVGSQESTFSQFKLCDSLLGFPYSIKLTDGLWNLRRQSRHLLGFERKQPLLCRWPLCHSVITYSLFIIYTKIMECWTQACVVLLRHLAP